MRPTKNHLSTTAVRAEALFVSALQGSEEPGPRQVREAVAAAVRRFGGPGCAGLVAQEFGDHPETAAARMRWACQLTAEAFGEPGWPAPRERPSAQRPARCAA
jgi:hypothetical protein